MKYKNDGSATSGERERREQKREQRWEQRREQRREQRSGNVNKPS